MEMLDGAARLDVGARRSRLKEAINSLIARFKCLPLDEFAARSYAQMSGRARRAGRTISMGDAQIAAVAHANGLRRWRPATPGRSKRWACKCSTHGLRSLAEGGTTGSESARSQPISFEGVGLGVGSQLALNFPPSSELGAADSSTLATRGPPSGTSCRNCPAFNRASATRHDLLSDAAADRPCRRRARRAWPRGGNRKSRERV